MYGSAVLLINIRFSLSFSAASVEYDAIGFLEKHTDSLQDDLLRLIENSSEGFVRPLLKKNEDTTAPSNSKGGRGQPRML